MPLQEKAASQVLAKQSLLAEILHNEELSELHVKAIEKSGWRLWQSNVDYTDLAYDVTYQTKEESNDERYSLNLHLTFCWEDKSVYMVFGTNLGDGFNDYHQIQHDDKTLDEELDSYIEGLSNAAEMGAEEDEYLALVTKHPEALAKYRSEQIEMPDKIMSHELARMLLEQPNQVVMVNADYNACETEELTKDTFQLGSKENGDHAGGVTNAANWVKLGK